MLGVDRDKMGSKVFARVAFYPTLMFGYVMTQLTKRRWYDRIDDTVVLGALPLRKMVAPSLIQKENVKAVISLVEPYETGLIPSEQEWREMGLQDFLWLPTRDYWGAPSPTDLQQALAVLDKHRLLPSTVYVHCKAGRTRSATLVTCYLIQRYYLSPPDAFELIKSRRPHVWLRTQQWSAIYGFYDSLVKEGNFQQMDLRNHPDIKL